MARGLIVISGVMLVAALAGCTAMRERQLVALSDYCSGMGLTKGSDVHAQCMITVDQANRTRAAIAGAAGAANTQRSTR